MLMHDACRIGAILRPRLQEKFITDERMTFGGIGTWKCLQETDMYPLLSTSIHLYHVGLDAAELAVMHQNYNIDCTRIERVMKCYEERRYV